MIFIKYFYRERYVTEKYEAKLYIRYWPSQLSLSWPSSFHLYITRLTLLDLLIEKHM